VEKGQRIVFFFLNWLVNYKSICKYWNYSSELDQIRERGGNLWGCRQVECEAGTLLNTTNYAMH